MLFVKQLLAKGNSENNTSERITLNAECKFSHIKSLDEYLSRTKLKKSGENETQMRAVILGDPL